jgi:sialate O-acetylesterase
MNFSAVGYYFGRDLVKHLGVPVGLIHGSTGGSKAEAWTSHEMLASNPALAPILQRYSNDVVATYPERLAKFQADEARVKADYATACAQALAQGKPTPRPPSLTPPVDPAKGNVHTPSGLFNGVIHPILHYPMRGVIWYQGETNMDRAAEYRDLFPALIADWRAQWGQGDFPFLFVQLPPYRGTPPDIREAQFLTLAKAANTAMVVTTDCGDTSDIHPNRKEPVGQRLALAARSLAYGEKLEYSGPLYSASRIEGNKVILSFTHTGSGLMAKDGPLKGFTIAGADQKFVPAQAEITGETVTVSSPDVALPTAVRYGWSNVPDVNLFNKDGLPASPFRTDNFPMIGDPKSIQPASSAKTFPSANPAQH